MTDAVQQIKDRLNILDVISPYVELHKAGKSYKGKSPFTNERTPSFYVSPERGMYYCFSTNQGGDMFTFISALEGVDFKGALKILADKAGVTLVPIAPEVQSKQDRMFAALEAATVYFSDQLAVRPEQQAYLEGRGLKPETIAKWRIGFAPGPPQGWRLLRDHLKQQGFNDDEIKSVGLSKSAEAGKEPYDVFRNRIMFPLFDVSGRVVAFSGRTIETGPDIPKYVNSPETDLYKKSELLFGYDRAKNLIRKFDFSLIVEGQFDVVLCHQAGYGNAVAVSGTALTPLHIMLLERQSKRVVLALDADKAGLNAMRRAADLMLRRGFDVKVAELVGGKDPADLVAKDLGLLKEVVRGAKPVIEFLLKQLKSQGLDERVLKLKAREDVVPYIALIPNRMDQDHFETKVAEALGVSKDAIHFEVERLREQASGVVPPVSQLNRDAAKDELKKDSRVENLSQLILVDAGFLSETERQRVDQWLATFSDATLSRLWEGLSSNEQASLTLRQELSNPGRSRVSLIADYLHALNLYRNLYLKERLAETKSALREAELAGDAAQIDLLLSDTARWQKLLQNPPVGEGSIFDPGQL